MEKKVICVDLFCGCGGLTKGLRDAGIQVLRGVDNDETARRTYETNNFGLEFMMADMKDVSAGEVMNGIDRTGSDLLLAGCVPCQPFSRHVLEPSKDDRRSLIMRVGTMIRDILPEYILVENVPGFQKKSNNYHARFVRLLNDLEYHVDEKVINTAEYGIPQTRKRYILLASKKGKISVPKGTHENSAQATVRKFIGKFPPINAGEKSTSMENHATLSLSKTNLDRIKRVPKNGGSIRNIPNDLWPRCYRAHNGHTDTYGRMHWDKPAPTLTCRCISLSNGRFGHPEQNRAISVREAAALQTFPDDYVFYNSKTTNAMHIGNAVPVLLAQTLGKAIISHATV